MNVGPVSTIGFTGIDADTVSHSLTVKRYGLGRRRYAILLKPLRARLERKPSERWMRQAVRPERPDCYRWFPDVLMPVLLPERLRRRRKPVAGRPSRLCTAQKAAAWQW